jgi:hypothetical protein
MKKIITTLSILFLLTGISFAKNDSKQAIGIMQKMLISMDHIKTWQSDVIVVDTTQDKRITMNYHLIADIDDHAVAIVEDKKYKKITYVNNDGGYYIVRKREPIKQLEGKVFPFDMPTRYLKNLNLADVFDNFKFVIHKETDELYEINLIPVDSGKREAGADVVSMLRFTIYKEFNTLNMVQIFKNYSLKSNDSIVMKYDVVDNKIISKKGVFMNKYATSRELAITYSRSYAGFEDDENGSPQFQVKETWYKNVKINESLDEDVFDEEEY